MTAPSKILKNAEKYLNFEVSKRWAIKTIKPPYGQTGRPKAAITEDNRVFGFTVGEYWSHRADGNIILRIKEKFSGQHFEEPLKDNGDFSKKYRHFNSSKNIKIVDPIDYWRLARLEFSFLSDEIETAIPWLLDNYLKVKEVPEWIEEEHKLKIRIGDPLFHYLWTKKASDSYEKGLKRE